VSGALTLAGIDPDHTPLHRWLGAVWAALVQFLGTGVSVEGLEKLWRNGFSSEATVHGVPDRDSWGLLPEHLAGQQRLMDGVI
jgi:hypothetical protein